jgi:choline dehydrogenase
LPITLVKPLSRGSITINSTDIFQSPLIDWKAFTYPDLEIMIAALRINRKLIASEAMQPLEIVPGTDITGDSALRAVLRSQVVPTYSHPCCTCPMMKREFGGVVGTDLKVHGVENLRVVDAAFESSAPKSSHFVLVTTIPE